MRRLIAFCLSVAVLVAFAGTTFAQSTGTATAVCVLVAGPEPTSGWDADLLKAAIADGSATIVYAVDAGGVCVPFDSPTPPPGPNPTPQLISGHGSGQSASFYLVPGDYVVAWSAIPDAGSQCLVSLSVESSGGEFFHGRIANETVSDSAIRNNNIHGVPGGLYYIDAIAECDWVVVFAHVG